MSYHTNTTVIVLTLCEKKQQETNRILAHKLSVGRFSQIAPRLVARSTTAIERSIEETNPEDVEMDEMNSPENEETEEEEHQAEERAIQHAIAAASRLLQAGDQNYDFTANKVTVRNLLAIGPRRFVNPYFQRPYSWTGQVNVLLSKFASCLSTKQDQRKPV